MKRLFSYKIITAIIFMSLTACSSYENSPISANITSDIVIEKTEIDTNMASADIQDWQKAYNLFLRVREYSHWMSWHYFIQVWDVDYIWAQPMHEGIQFEFNQAVFFTAQKSASVT